MIAFIVGTSAELIKIAPVFREITDRGGLAEIWYTGMHMGSVEGMLSALELPPPTVWLARGARGEDVVRPGDVPRWGGEVLLSAWRRRRELRGRVGSGAVLVHGDTFTTVLGALVGKVLGKPVGHVEAGLRSGSLRSPFPEELNRRVVSRLVRWHFAPTAKDAANLKKRKKVVDTGANTVVDSLARVLERGVKLPEGLPGEYGLVTLHRFELVHDEERYRDILTRVAELAKERPLVMLLGASERVRIAELGYGELLEGVYVAPKMSYAEFVGVLFHARFVITDSGGLQEECSYLGVPCLVHRSHTERAAGLGENAVLSGMDVAKVEEFLREVDSLRRESRLGAKPSRRIVDVLEEDGVL